MMIIEARPSRYSLPDSRKTSLSLSTALIVHCSRGLLDRLLEKQLPSYDAVRRTWTQNLFRAKHQTYSTVSSHTCGSPPHSESACARNASEISSRKNVGAAIDMSSVWKVFSPRSGMHWHHHRLRTSYNSPQFLEADTGKI